MGHVKTVLTLKANTMKLIEKFRIHPAGTALLALLFLFLSCDSGGDADEGTGETGEPVGACANEMRAMDYAAGMQVARNPAGKNE